jgi:hypothetical protein
MKEGRKPFIIYDYATPLPSEFPFVRKISFSFLSVCGDDNKIIYLAGLAETSTHSWPGYRYINL